MTACPLCGHRNPDGTTACSACGHELGAAARVPRGRFFTPLACWLMFGVPVGAIAVPVAWLFIDAYTFRVTARLPDGMTTSITFGLLGGAGSGGAAGWAVASRRRWRVGCLGTTAFAAFGFVAGVAIFIGVLYAVMLTDPRPNR